jgi:hypothetical protein
MIRAACLALGLVACAQQPAAPPPLLLTCEGFARDASAESLARIHGAENVTEAERPGPEGGPAIPITVLYADDPARRLEIVWHDGAARARPASLTIAGDETEWNGPSGIKLHQAMTNTQRANGRPFTVSGFGWDYGGRVIDWQGGSLAGGDGCTVTVAFRPTVDTPDALGDRLFASDSPEMAAAIPRIAEITITLAP